MLIMFHDKLVFWNTSREIYCMHIYKFLWYMRSSFYKIVSQIIIRIHLKSKVLKSHVPICPQEQKATSWLERSFTNHFLENTREFHIILLKRERKKGTGEGAAPKSYPNHQQALAFTWKNTQLKDDLTQGFTNLKQHNVFKSPFTVFV